MRSNSTPNWIAGTVVAILLSATCYLLYTRLIPGSNWGGIQANRGLLFAGWLTTLVISTSALFLSITIAILRAPDLEWW